MRIYNFLSNSTTGSPLSQTIDKGYNKFITVFTCIGGAIMNRKMMKIMVFLMIFTMLLTTLLTGISFLM